MIAMPPDSQRGGPAKSRLHVAPPPGDTAPTVTGGPVNQAVADKLWRLHWDYGYFTRAEIEAALGLDPPPGRRECPGQFGADGKWKSCCGEAS